MSNETYSFLFASPAWFIGELSSDSFGLKLVYPSDSRARFPSESIPGPQRFSRFIFHFNILSEKITNSVLPSYAYVGDDISALLCSFYGKLILNLGSIECGGILTYPTAQMPPCFTYDRPAFNQYIRKPDGNELELSLASNIINIYIKSNNCDTKLLAILNASNFYKLALQNYHENPPLSFAFLISSIECLLDINEYSEDDLYDPCLKKDLKMIEDSLPDGKKICSRIKSRLFQVKRRVAAFCSSRVPVSFFQQREAETHAPSIADPAELVKRISAAYDLRSKLIHTGDRTELWYLGFDAMYSEIPINVPHINDKSSREDKEFAKSISKSTTLAGLERIVSTILRNCIKELIDYSL